ncbi:MAG TPA: cyclopropane-fatty-acyl-phospholipid synthase family protein [Bryobacteraceae bacterium]|nr:cyclopropane-fatty-acyl-phospholipid synthase family protein [Bryobacteraceae bacterium]
MGIVPRFADEWVLLRILKSTGRAPIRLMMKDGVNISPPGVSPVATVVLQDRQTLAGLLHDPEVGFGDAYMDGRIEVEGDLVALLEAIYQAMEHAPFTGSWYQRAASRWMDKLQDNSRHGSRNNIHRHYDLGNDFYKLWLDSQLLYTCAYFPTPSSTLEQAQIAKMDHVCRKLRLQPGETVVEAGCGWGALALHMAREYGVSVKAYNVSHQQIAYARERARAEGLSDRVEYIEDDYRAISGKYDVFVSVGMLEHVGEAHFAEFSDIIYRSIGDSGRGLLHFIGRNYPAVFSRWIRKHIFPGGFVPSLRQSLRVLEPKNYSVLDVENLRMHYAKTLEHWLERFEKSRQQVTSMYDSRFVRAWRLYLAGSIAAFRIGHLQLFQILFTGSQREPIFWTRDPLYADTGALPDDAQPIVEQVREKVRWTHAMS